MVKDETFIWLGVVAVGGFLIYKSGILEGLGNVAEGVGTASEGLGGAISDISGGVSSGVVPVLVQGGSTVREVFYQTEKLTSAVGSDIVKTADNLGNLAVDTSGLASNWSSFFKDTWSPTGSTSIFQNIGLGLKSLFTKKTQSSPNENVQTFVQSQKSADEFVKSITPLNPLTVAISKTSSPSATKGSGGSSVSVKKITTSTQNKFLENLGYQGRSSLEGITYSKPLSSVFR
jgi:hypothetical protein